MNEEEKNEEWIEKGLGLIALGMLKIGDEKFGNDPKLAYEYGMSAVSIIREMSFEFLKKVSSDDRASL